MDIAAIDFVRTPAERFDDLPDFPFTPHYGQVPGNLRMHYVDEGPSDGPVVVLLHGEPSWSFLYRKMIPILAEAGFRVIAPDFVGFGRSDKPTEVAYYTYARHVEWCSSLLRSLDLRDITLFCQDWGGPIGLSLVADAGERFTAVLAANTILPTASTPPDGEVDGWTWVIDPAPDTRTLRYEVLARVLQGEVPLLVTAHRAHDIATALRLAREFGFRLVLDGAAESYRMLDEIIAADVPVIVHPTMFRAIGEAENLSLETPGVLRRAGIRVALQSGYESYVPRTRVILFEAAEAAAYGLSFEDALALITIDAARLLGIDGRVGSLEPGKVGDLALYDGDPFEYATHCTGVVIEGEIVSSTPR